MKILAAVMLVLGASSAWAFPEMVRHGYTNCTACHVSPTGGGVLTEYGRSLSKEILSTWAFKNEERFAYIIQPPEWLHLGGDLRLLNIQTSTTAGATNQYIPMQRDLEAGITVGKLTIDGTFGYRYPDVREGDGWFSRRHFLLLQLTDELSVRAGRFFPAFGILIPEHNALIRRGLGWDEGQESYNLEFNYLGEKYNLQLTGIFGRPDFSTLYREQGGAATVTYSPADSYKIGFSYYYGSSPLTSHHYLGPWAILGFTKHFFLLSQIDYTRSYSSTDVEPKWGLVDFQRLDYELFQGFHLFAVQEMQQTDLNNGLTRVDGYWLGAQFFPRPHFDFEAFWEKSYNALQSPPADLYVGMFHFYL